VEHRRHAGDGARRLAGSRAEEGRQGAHPQRRHHRQPVGEDDAKGGARGYDAGKQVKGRKRFICVDTVGLLWLVAILTGDIQERDGGRFVLAAVPALKDRFPRLQLIGADGGFAGQLEEWVATVCQWMLAIVRKVKAKGFEVLPHRWIVERTFGWFGNFRRLDKDYEVNPVHSQATLYWAMTQVMVRRLTGGQVRWKARAP